MKNKKIQNLIASSAVILSVVTLSPAQAANGWTPLEIIDMTETGQADLDFVITTGFLNDLNFVSLDEKILSVTPEFPDTPLEEKSGWAGLVEVEFNQDKILPLGNISAFSDTLTNTDRERRMSWFYSMRYAFESDVPVRPYAAAGLGVVASTTDTDTAGIVAARATAGFDLSFNEQSSVFAEYAFVKNGGVDFGTAQGGITTRPDDEHSIKLGFKRNF